MRKIVFVLCLILGFGLILGTGCQTKDQDNQNSQVGETTDDQQGNVEGGGGNPQENSLSVEDSDSRSDDIEFVSDYGYSLEYPRSYGENNEYTIWQSDEEDFINDLIETWGINMGQQTIISISAYPKDKKEEVLSYYDYSVRGEIEKVGNISGDKMYIKAGNGGEMLYGLVVENGEYFYIIKSSFIDLPDYEEYSEYKTILDSIEFS